MAPETWNLVVEYGPERVEIVTVTLWGVTESIADEGARALLQTSNAAVAAWGWEYGTAVRMDKVAGPPLAA